MDEAGKSFPPQSFPQPSPQPWGAPATASPSLRPVEFVSNGKTFLKLLARGALLELVTFGFYRFWLATGMRRHLWSHTLADGENAEYTGTGRELLVGFLFALAILLPIYGAYFLVGIEAERLQAFASVPLGLFMVLFGMFAQYRARRYRLTRTIWRGLRFWMTGSGWNYAFRGFFWMILVVMTLGLVYPWRAAALERYKMANTHYGDLQGGFDARASEFFKKGVLLWFLALGPTIAILAFGLVSLANSRSSDSLAFIAIAPVLVIFSGALVYPFFKALEWRWWATGVHLGATRLQCNLRGGQLFGLFLKYMVIVSLATGMAASLLFAIGMAIAQIAGISVKSFDPENLNNTLADMPYVAIGGVVLIYLIVAMVAGVVQRFFMQHEYWKLISSTITMINPEALENVAAKGQAANAIGEGLADSLDVAGF